MEINDLGVILAYGRSLFPREFERYSAIYPPRLVLVKLFDKHPEDMFKILKMLFKMSEEYKLAETYINSLASDKPER